MNDQNNDKLMKFGAYTKALELFDFVVADLEHLIPHRECDRLASQQLSSADSITANIEEGCGCESKKEYAHFLTISRGSAKETSGRYRRLRHWIPIEVVEERIALCGEIVGILTATIKRLRSQISSTI